jgi:hypothetical protein
MAETPFGSMEYYSNSITMIEYDLESGAMNRTNDGVSLKRVSSTCRARGHALKVLGNQLLDGSRRLPLYRRILLQAGSYRPSVGRASRAVRLSYRTRVGIGELLRTATAATREEEHDRDEDKAQDQSFHRTLLAIKAGRYPYP